MKFISIVAFMRSSLAVALAGAAVVSSCGGQRHDGSDVAEVLIPRASSRLGAVIVRMQHNGKDVVAIRECEEATYVAMLNGPRCDFDTASFKANRILPYEYYMNALATRLGVSYAHFLQKEVRSFNANEYKLYLLERALETRERVELRYSGSSHGIAFNDVIDPFRHTSELQYRDRYHVDLLLGRRWLLPDAARALSTKAEAELACVNSHASFDIPTLEEARQSYDWFLSRSHFLGFSRDGNSIFGEMAIGKQLRKAGASAVEKQSGLKDRVGSQHALFWVREGSRIEAIAIGDSGDAHWVYGAEHAGVICVERYGTRFGVSWIAEPRGYRISFVHPGLPADKAGLKVGDLLTSFDGESLAGKSLEEAGNLISRNPRRIVPFTAETISNVAGRENSPVLISGDVQFESPPIGVRLGMGVTIESIPNYGSIKGARVVNVQSGSVAEEAGVEVGDYIVTFNHERVSEKFNFHDAIRLVRGQWSLRLEVLRKDSRGRYFSRQTIDLNFNR